MGIRVKDAGTSPVSVFLGYSLLFFLFLFELSVCIRIRIPWFSFEFRDEIHLRGKGCDDRHN